MYLFLTSHWPLPTTSVVLLPGQEMFTRVWRCRSTAGMPRIPTSSSSSAAWRRTNSRSLTQTTLTCSTLLALIPRPPDLLWSSLMTSCNALYGYRGFIDPLGAAYTERMCCGITKFGVIQWNLSEFMIFTCEFKLGLFTVYNTVIKNITWTYPLWLCSFLPEQSN